MTRLEGEVRKDKDKKKEKGREKKKTRTLVVESVGSVE